MKNKISNCMKDFFFMVMKYFYEIFVEMNVIWNYDLKKILNSFLVIFESFISLY